jgi:hypothetical protein
MNQAKAVRQKRVHRTAATLTPIQLLQFIRGGKTTTTLHEIILHSVLKSLKKSIL